MCWKGPSRVLASPQFYDNIIKTLTKNRYLPDRKRSDDAMAQRSYETHYDTLRHNGANRRDFLKFCTMTAAALGLGPTLAPTIAHALETKPCLPVV